MFTLDQSLFGLLEAAGAAARRPNLPRRFDVDGLLAQVSEWSGWPLGDLTYLTGPSGFNLSLPDAMRDERAFVDLRRAFDRFQRTGVSAEQAHAWTIAELTFSETQSIKQALSLSYDPDAGWTCWPPSRTSCARSGATPCWVTCCTRWASRTATSSITSI